MRLKVLVLGSTGLIGHQVFKHLDVLGNYDMYNISYRQKLNKGSILCDVRNEEEIISLIKSINPNIIINCIGTMSLNCSIFC